MEINPKGDAYIDMEKQIHCRLCEGVIDTSVDKTVCGYGKCVKCCTGCMHRTHYNPNSQAGRDALANELNRAVLSHFFGGIK